MLALISLDTPHILVPACASSMDRFELQPGSLRIQNLDPGANLADIFQVNFERTSLEAWRGDQKTTLFDFDMEVKAVRALAVDDTPEKLALTVSCTEIELLVEREICDLLRDIIQHNLTQTVTTLDMLKNSGGEQAIVAPSDASTAETQASTFELDITLPQLAIQRLLAGR